MADMNDTMDFGAMLEQFEAGRGAKAKRETTRIRAGDKVTGTITSIDSKTVFIDVNALAEAMLDRAEVLDKEGKPTVKVGDTIEAMCIRADEDGEIRLTKRMTGETIDAALWDAYQAKIPVEGRVTAETKGGFKVTIGTQEGFCPFSQMDISKAEPAAYIGQKFLFQVREYTQDGRRLVVTRRPLLEAEQETARAEMQKSLGVGDKLEGTVKKLMPFGVFVDIGGIDGLVPMSELAWKRGVKAEDVVSVGQKVTVVIRDIDWDKKRISLTMRTAETDPWAAACGKYTEGTKHTGTISKTLEFGAFVELEPGIEGLIPIGKLGKGRRLNHASEAVKEGDPVEVQIESVDYEKRRLSLSVTAINAEELAARTENARLAATVVVGAELTCPVESLKEFGAFIRLPNGKSGLLHISRMGLTDGPARLRQMHGQFGVGKDVKVLVNAIDGDRVSLSLPGVKEQGNEGDEEEAAYREYRQAQPKADGPLGNMSSVFGALDKLKLD